MAATETVDSSPAKKRRTEEEDDDKPSKLASIFSDGDSDHDDYVPLTEDSKKQISDFKDAFEKSGGFDVPKIPPSLLGCVVPPIQCEDPVACRTDKDLIDVVNTAIRHHKKKKEKNERMDLVLVEILSSASELHGTWQNYITFKARDSSGAVRTYETRINPMFRDEDVILEVFRVKPYTTVEYPGHNTVEQPSAFI